MLKIIGSLVFLLLSSNAFSHEYEVVVSDETTGEVAVEKCANEIELNTVTDNIQNLNDKAVKFYVNKLNISVGVMGVKLGGGEGGTD